MSSSLKDTMQFKVPIPTSYLQRKPYSYNQYGNNENELSNGFIVPPSMWGGSIESNGMERRRIPAFDLMPPPPVPYRRPHQSFQNESAMSNNQFFGNNLIHSTPYHRGSAHGQQSNSAQGPMEFSHFYPNWNKAGSMCRRGSESVRSFSSTNTDYVDRVFTKALSKFLAKSAVNPDLQEMAIHVANGLRKYAQEAAEELAPPESSSRSVYSEKGSTWRSGLSVISECSQGTFQSLLRGGRADGPNEEESTCSIQCTVEGSRARRRSRIHHEPTKTKLTTDINIEVPMMPIGRVYQRPIKTCVEKSMEPKRAFLTDSDSSSDNNFHDVPQTVKRNKKNDSALSGVQVLGSPAITSLMNEIAMERHEKIKKATKKAEELKRLQDAPRKRRSKVTKKVSSTNIQITKKNPVPQENVTTTISTTTTVQCTRSGRNVRKPIYYQVPKPTGKKVKQEETTSIDIEISVSGKDHAVTYSRKIKQTKPLDNALKKTKKPATQKAKSITLSTNDIVNVPIENVVHTRSGRVVKKTHVFGRDLQLSSSLNDSTHKKHLATSAKENVPPKRKKGRCAKTGQASKSNTGKKENTCKEPIETVDVGMKKSTNLDESELSFVGADFYIPEVTQSTRRAGAKTLTKKALGTTLGSQTPPLIHFTAHLPSNLVGTSTPAQQTPDWQISQRSQSELKEFQKRRVQQKKNKVVKAKVKNLSAKPSKAMLEAMKIMCGPKPAGTAMLPAYGYCSDSDTSEISGFET